MSESEKQRPTVLIAARIPAEMFDALKNQALANERTFSGELRLILKTALDQKATA